MPSPFSFFHVILFPPTVNHAVAPIDEFVQVLAFSGKSVGAADALAPITALSAQSANAATKIILSCRIGLYSFAIRWNAQDAHRASRDRTSGIPGPLGVLNLRRC